MKLSRRFFLGGVSASALVLSSSKSHAWFPHGVAVGSGPPAASNIWMETPDILAFTVDDPPNVPGNTVSGSFSGDAYETWFQMTNPRSGNLEWCIPFGPTRSQVRFSDMPNPAGYLSKIDLENLANYSISGGITATALYYRNEANGQGETYSQAKNSPTCLMITQRHTVYLKLSSTLTQSSTYTITNSAGTFSPITFTFNDKKMRAGGIQINQVGPRPDDTYKNAYLASRVPISPNSGAIDFVGTYGFSAFHIIDSSGTSVFTGSIVKRVGVNDPEKITTFVGFIDDGTGGGSPSGVAGNKLTITSFTAGFITPGQPATIVVSLDPALSAGTIKILTFVSGVNGGAGVYTVSSSILVSPGNMWIPDGYTTGIDVADLSAYYPVTGMTVVGSTSITVTSPAHPFVNGDKVRFVGLSGMESTILGIASISQGPTPVGSAGDWIGATVTVIDANTFSVNLNGSSHTAFSATPIYSNTFGSVNNKVVKCFNTNRAGTYVFGLDHSTWTPGGAGPYNIYIPGYGISDPIPIASNNWAQAAAACHEGLYNLRLGCAVNLSPGYSRGIALADGVNGTTNYFSLLPAPFASECASQIVPVGGTSIPSGLGAYSNEGVLTFSSGTPPTWSGGIVSATATVPHGIPNGTIVMASIIGCVPTGYNGTVTITSTGTSTFTYPVAASPGTMTTFGVVLTGFVTNTRATGYASRTQDAGDNDDLACDHLPAWAFLAWTLFELQQASRVTPFAVPPTTSLLDPTLYAGADSLPPLVQELFWYADGYRTSQDASGFIWGGMGVGHFSSQIPNYPEPISFYRGTDAGGNLTGQTVMGFMYAADHWGTFAYAALAAKIAQLAYDYSLTTLGDTWKASAIAAYSWADNILTNQSARDTYYNTTLNLSTKMGWTSIQYQSSMVTLNARAVIQKTVAAGFLFRLLGSTAGLSPYGNFITQLYCGATPTIASGGGGTSFAVGDTVSLGNGIVLLVTTVSSGVITGVSLMNQGQFTSTPTNPVAQVSTTGSGTGASFNLVSAASGYYTSTNTIGTVGALDYIQTSGANAAAVTYLKGHYNLSISQLPATYYLSPSISYQGMYSVGTTSGGTELNNPMQMIQAHRNFVLTNGIPASVSNTFLTSLQAGCTFLQGANLPNRAFVTGMGTRSQVIALHEDSYRLGVPTPRGINVFGYFAWATSSMVFNFGDGVNSDGPLVFDAEYSTGSFQVEPTPGSAKLWDPLRWASSYWEWAPQNKDIIFSCEFNQAGLIGTIISQLYLHGWDNNT